jgi:hypothetical protein
VGVSIEGPSNDERTEDENRELKKLLAEQLIDNATHQRDADKKNSDANTTTLTSPHRVVQLRC